MVCDHKLLNSSHPLWSALHHQIPTLQILRKEQNSIAVTKYKSNSLQSCIYTSGRLLPSVPGALSWSVRCYVQYASHAYNQTKFAIILLIFISCLSFHELERHRIHCFGNTDHSLIRKRTWILVLDLFNKYVLITYYVPGSGLGDWIYQTKIPTYSCGVDGHM